MNTWELLSRFASAGIRRHKLVVIVACVFYVLIAAALVQLGQLQVNVDAIAYVQMARHFLAGNGLGINSWFSPGLPWLLMPGIAMGLDGILWARLLQIPAGLGFAWGVSTLIAQWRGSSGSLAGFLLGLCAALIMQTGVITPDVWHAFVLTWYFVAAHALLIQGGLGRAGLTGAVGGIAYLVKAYSLPFVIAHLTMTLLLRQLRHERPWTKFSSTLMCWAISLAMTLVIAGPWVAKISARDGEFTFSSAGRYWTVAQPIDPQDPVPIQGLVNLTPGRIAAVENFRELPLDWKPAPPFSGASDLLKASRRNLREIFTTLGQLDGVGLTMALLLFSLVAVFPVNGLFRDDGRLFVAWGLLSIAIYLGGYALVYFEYRFHWAIWGLMLALCVGVPQVAVRRLGHAGGNAAAASQLTMGWNGAVAALLGILLLVNTAATAGIHRIGSAHRLEQELKQTAGRVAPGQVLASTDWGSGAIFAFWNNGRFLGSPTGRTAEDIANELRPYQRCLFLVFRNAPLGKALSSQPGFRRVELQSAVVEAFEFNAQP